MPLSLNTKEAWVGQGRRVPEWLRIREESLPIRTVACGLGAHRKSGMRVPVSDSLQSKKQAPVKIRGLHEDGKKNKLKDV